MPRKIPISDGLQLDEHPRFQRADWRAQRIGWAVMAAIILATIAGALGSGPVAERKIALASGDTVQVDRVVRHEAPTRLALYVVTADRGDVVLVDVAREFVAGIDITRIDPEPVQSSVGAGLIRYVFARAAPGPLRITFTYDSERYWTQRGWVRIGGGQPVRFSQIVLP